MKNEIMALIMSKSSEYRCRGHRTKGMKTLFLAGLLAAMMMSGSVLAAGGCGSAITTNAGLKLISVKGMDNITCDRPNIQAAIDAAGSNYTVLLKGEFQFDGTAVSISKSNITLTGVPFVMAHLKGVLGTDGLPQLDKGGYLYFNRPLNIGPDLTTGVASNITIANLHLSGFGRSIAASSLGSVSNLCKDLTDSGQVNNINVLFNRVDNSLRSPQAFGAVHNMNISFNDFNSGEGVILAGGDTGCFPLVGATKQYGAGAGGAFVYVDGTTTGLKHVLTPDPVTHICNNNGTPQLLAVNVGGTYVCPVCSDDVVLAMGGSNSNRCGSADAKKPGFGSGFNITCNRMKADTAFLATNDAVHAMSTQGSNANVVIAFNEISGGNNGLEIGSQTVGSLFEVKNNYFHDCGSDPLVAGLRVGAIEVGDIANQDDLDFNGLTYDPLANTTGITIHDNLYHNNIANKVETVVAIFDIGIPQSAIDANPLYTPVPRDIWLAKTAAFGNTVKENLCVVRVLDDNAPNNTIGVACGHH